MYRHSYSIPLFLFALPLVAGSLVGCSTTSVLIQSTAIKQEAIKLDAQVQTFKTQKQAQVDALNKSFRDATDKLREQLSKLCDKELDLERDLDAQAIADKATSSEPNALDVLMPAAIHDASLQSVNNQFAQIQAVEAKINSATTAYAQASHTLQLAMKNLDTIHTSLQKLIQENNNDDAQVILADVQGALEGIQNGIAQEKKAASSTPAAQ